MKVLVIFGSQSDVNIYEPLKARLIQEGHEVDFRMISVHRSPDLLDKEISQIRDHVIIAGAGLAAHLPGVLASKTLLPVFGIPCAAALGGVDAYLSISQMPFGIPVLATGPDQYGSAVDFVSRISKLNLRFTFTGFNLILEKHKRNLPHFQLLMERAKKIAEKSNLELEIWDTPQTDAVNICLVEIDQTDPECPLPFGPPAKNSQEVRIHVPVFNEQAYRDTYSSITLMRRVSTVPYSVWTGVNNIGNGMLAALQLANSSGSHNAFLTNAKKGYIHA